MTVPSWIQIEIIKKLAWTYMKIEPKGDKVSWNAYTIIALFKQFIYKII